MASPRMIGNIDLSFTYRNRATGPTTATPLTTPADYVSPETLDSALATANATVYTAATLAKMSINDKTFALRRLNDAGTV